MRRMIIVTIWIILNLILKESEQVSETPVVGSRMFYELDCFVNRNLVKKII